jgi:glycosidase
LEASTHEELIHMKTLTPEWVWDSVFYMILPDRFSRKKPERESWDSSTFENWEAPPGLRAYKGGNLAGIRDKLGYLSDLGITALYLTPIFTSPTYHRYKPVNFFEVDPLLGGNEEFERLIEECHGRDIRIVLDAVFNHVGIAFPQFQDVIEYGTASPWKNWFYIDSFPVNPYEQLKPRNFRGWHQNRTMPELNHQNPEVREFVLRVAEHWVRKGIDGWRFDHPQNMNTPGFWQEMRSRLKRINPDVYLVGELWTDASKYLDGTQWDGVMNYPLMGAIHRFAAGARMQNEHLLEGARNQTALTAQEFAHHIESLIGRVPWEIQLAQLNFINTNDLARFITVAGEDHPSVQLATILLFTLPGAPAILYGDEVGLQGGLSPDSRRGFPAESNWDRSSLDFHKEMIQLRNIYAPLRRGTYKRLRAERMLFLFERRFSDEMILIAINAGMESDQIAFPSAEIPGHFKVQQLFGAGHLTKVSNNYELNMPGRSGGIFRIS